MANDRWHQGRAPGSRKKVNNPIYRDNSRSIQKAIAKKNGLSSAADLLEQAFGLTKKTEASVQKVA
jgi:hypothetical protein